MTPIEAVHVLIDALDSPDESVRLETAVYILDRTRIPENPSE